MEMYTTIKTLWKKGKNKSEIARITNHDWKTVNKVIKRLRKGEEEPARREQKKIIDDYKSIILEKLEIGLNGVRIYEDLLEEMKFPGSYSTVKRYLNKIKKNKDIYLVLNTLPGDEAQVDFGYVGLTNIDEKKKKKTWVFNMRLSHSRYDYYEKVYDQTVETFIKCHINAFEYFCGVPRTVKIDNLKAAILEANFYEPVYQRLYKQFATYYDFDPVPCQVRHPEEKGKVESGVKYVKSNFFKGRTFKDGKECDLKLRDWFENKSNKRIHGTTKKVPYEVFIEKEKDLLKPLPDVRFEFGKYGTRNVHHNCHIHIDNSYYSIPYEYIGEKVEIEVKDNLVRIYKQGKLITTHVRAKEKGCYVTKKEHYPPYKVYSETEFQEKYKIKMRKIGPYAEMFLLGLINEKKRYWSRIARGIVSLTNKYSDEIVNKACKRALEYEIFSYQCVKNICERGAYNLPLEPNKQIMKIKNSKKIDKEITRCLSEYESLFN